MLVASFALWLSCFLMFMVIYFSCSVIYHIFVFEMRRITCINNIYSTTPCTAFLNIATFLKNRDLFVFSLSQPHCKSGCILALFFIVTIWFLTFGCQIRTFFHFIIRSRSSILFSWLFVNTIFTLFYILIIKYILKYDHCIGIQII